MVVKVGKDTYSSRRITLDGNSIPVDISTDFDKTQNIKVSLKTTGVTETKTVDGKKSNNISIDFSSASNYPSASTTQPESTQTNN